MSNLFELCTEYEINDSTDLNRFERCSTKTQCRRNAPGLPNVNEVPFLKRWQDQKCFVSADEYTKILKEKNTPLSKPWKSQELEE